MHCENMNSLDSDIKHASLVAGEARKYLNFPNERIEKNNFTREIPRET